MFLQSNWLSWTVHPELESFCKHRLNFLLNLSFILVSIFLTIVLLTLWEWDICHFFTNSFLLLFFQSFGYIPECRGSCDLVKFNLMLLLDLALRSHLQKWPRSDLKALISSDVSICINLANISSSLRSHLSCNFYTNHRGCWEPFDRSLLHF